MQITLKIELPDVEYNFLLEKAKKENYDFIGFWQNFIKSKMRAVIIEQACLNFLSEMKGN